MEYIYYFDVAAVANLTFILISVISKKGLRRKTNLFYLGMVLTSMIAAFSDIALCAMYIAKTNDDVLNDTFHFLYLCFHSMLPLLLVYYIILLLGYEVSVNKIHYFIYSIPEIIAICVLISNAVNHKVFYYNTEGEYRRGPYMNIIYAVACIYIIVAFVLIYTFRRKLTRRYSMPLLLIIVLSVLPVGVQFFMPKVFLEIFCQSVGFLGLLLAIENKEDEISQTTGVFNRYVFLENASRSMLNRRHKSLVVIKLPNVHYYNSTIGVSYTAELLQEIAHWLDKRRKDMDCYDCDNGHFVLMGDVLSNNDIEKLKAEINKRFKTAWGRGEFQTTFPIQICSMNIPGDVTNMEDLLLVTDLPFDGTQSAELDEKEIVSIYQRRTLVEKLINDALKNRSFQVWFQPIWNHDTGTFTSAEALIRLIDEEHGFIPPDEFIPIAEENGSIIDIGEFVFEEVCRYYQEHSLDKLGVHYIEVNLSVIQCMNKKLAERFNQILKKYHMDSKHINLEITESAAYGNRFTLLDSINALEKTGFTFSLDDYGTGYSNIAYMYDMPFNIIKLDKSILWSAVDPKTADGDMKAKVYLENTIHMMQKMGYEILVEGVETVEQKICLENLGCNFFQGYFFSKPIPGEAYLDYIKVVNAG